MNKNYVFFSWKNNNSNADNYFYNISINFKLIKYHSSMRIAPRSWGRCTWCISAFRSLLETLPFYWELGNFTRAWLVLPFFQELVEAPYLFRSFHKLLDRRGASTSSSPFWAGILGKSAKTSIESLLLFMLKQRKKK